VATPDCHRGAIKKQLRVGGLQFDALLMATDGGGGDSRRRGGAYPGGRRGESRLGRSKSGRQRRNSGRRRWLHSQANLTHGEKERCVSVRLSSTGSTMSLAEETLTGSDRYCLEGDLGEGEMGR
jgi:hypothetical protein